MNAILEQLFGKAWGCILKLREHCIKKPLQISTSLGHGTAGGRHNGRSDSLNQSSSDTGVLLVVLHVELCGLVFCDNTE